MCVVHLFDKIITNIDFNCIERHSVVSFRLS